MLAALYDIHGNLPALEAALRESLAAGVDRIVVGGDIMPGPMAAECLALLSGLALPVTFIKGNGEVAVLAERDGRDSGVPAQYRAAIQWTAKALPDEQLVAIRRWPMTARIGDVLFCHATPRNEYEIFTKATPEARLAPIFEAGGAATVVCGHTHMQFDRHVGRVRVLNAGSVGMPFGAPGACWLLLGPEPEFRSTGYDLSGAAERLRQAAYPGAADFATNYVLNRPSEEQMLAAYARAELNA